MLLLELQMYIHVNIFENHFPVFVCKSGYHVYVLQTHRAAEIHACTCTCTCTGTSHYVHVMGYTVVYTCAVGELTS